jgi:hypothetical protein
MCRVIKEINVTCQTIQDQQNAENALHVTYKPYAKQ